MNIRIGQGYDIHPLAAGRRLVLGGVEIEHDKGPAGHSDADALVHAVIDALLGAAALGDIGTLFPDTDPALKDADSISLLKQVVGRLEKEAWRVANIDATIIAQHPRLAPHISSMRRNLAEALDISADRVSVKAKTNEGIDAVGRGEAIAVQAVALVHRWVLFKNL